MSFRKTVQVDDPRHRQPDIKLAKDQLGWHPNIGLEDGLRRTIEYFEMLLKNDAA